MQKLILDHIACEMTVPGVDDSLEQKFFVRIDPELCNGCGVCQTHCPTDAIYGETGATHKIIHPEPCLHCGQCLINCAQGAIYETYSWLPEIEKKLADSETACIAMPAPSLRYTIGEAFGYRPGWNLHDQLLNAYPKLGFAHTWDVEFAADVTIWEEASEFMERLESNGLFPQFSTCCPSWQKYIEYFQPDLLPHLSSCKSPAAINGRLAKTYGADRFGLDAKQIYTVAILPCISKKYEALRPELAADGIRDIDAVLTARELAWLLQKHNIDLPNLPAGMPDTLMGESSGGTLFGRNGGVAQTLGRFVWQKAMGAKPNAKFLKVKSATPAMTEYQMRIHDMPIQIAAVYGAKHFAAVCDAVRAGNAPWHFVEFMACPGGCVNGGGQPLLPRMRGILQNR